MKSAFVSGGTRGIGRSVALELAKCGYEVGFCYQNSTKEAKLLLEEINRYTKGYAYCTDLSDYKEVTELSKRILHDMPNLSVLVNNAGVSMWGLFQDITEEEFDRIFSVNFRSAFFLTKALVLPMIQNQKGRVVNISSVWGQTGASCEVLYSASKSAIIGFTKALAKELAPSGVTVNCVAPGVVDTDMMVGFSSDAIRALKEEIPIGRFAEPDEIAALVRHLVDEKAGFITGQVIGINGGMYC